MSDPDIENINPVGAIYIKNLMPDISEKSLKGLESSLLNALFTTQENDKNNEINHINTFFRRYGYTLLKGLVADYQTFLILKGKDDTPKFVHISDLDPQIYKPERYNLVEAYFNIVV